MGLPPHGRHVCIGLTAAAAASCPRTLPGLTLGSLCDQVKFIADPGANEAADPGANEAADPGADEAADPGANEVADPGADEAADPGPGAEGGLVAPPRLHRPCFFLGGRGDSPVGFFGCKPTPTQGARGRKRNPGFFPHTAAGALRRLRLPTCLSDISWSADAAADAGSHNG